MSCVSSVCVSVCLCLCVCVCETGKSQLSPTELLERPSGGIDSYLRTGKVWLSGKKDIAERLLKNTSAKTDVKGFFGGLESKLRGPLGRKNEWVIFCHCFYSLFYLVMLLLLTNSSVVLLTSSETQTNLLNRNPKLQVVHDEPPLCF